MFCKNVNIKEFTCSDDISYFVIYCGSCGFENKGLSIDYLWKKHKKYAEVKGQKTKSNIYCSICENLKNNNHFCFSHIVTRDCLDVLSELK